MPFGKKKNKAKGSNKKENPAKSLGVRIGEIYVGVMSEIIRLVESRPAPAELKPQLVEIRDNTITRLVALGKQKEVLDPSQKAAVDLDINAQFRQLPRADFQAFSQAVTHYRALDNDLANLLAEFNTITQYADFALLRNQKPAEANRLGI